VNSRAPQWTRTAGIEPRETTSPRENEPSNRPMKRFATSGHRAVNADGIRSAAEMFADRKARRDFGSRGHVGAFRIDSERVDGKCVEVSALIGARSGNTTTGHNVIFSVFEL